MNNSATQALKVLGGNCTTSDYLRANVLAQLAIAEQLCRIADSLRESSGE